MSKLLRDRLLDMGEEGFSVSDTYVSGQVDIPLSSSQHVSRQLFQMSPAVQIPIPSATDELPRTPLASCTATAPSSSDYSRDAPSPFQVPPVPVSTTGATWSTSHFTPIPSATYELPRTPLPPTTCLLYTSPSPRDKRQSRMPSSA